MEVKAILWQVITVCPKFDLQSRVRSFLCLEQCNGRETWSVSAADLTLDGHIGVDQYSNTVIGTLAVDG